MAEMSKSDLFSAKSENLAWSQNDSQTKDTLTEGLIGLLGPSVEQVDERVRLVR